MESAAAATNCRATLAPPSSASSSLAALARLAPPPAHCWASSRRCCHSRGLQGCAAVAAAASSPAARGDTCCARPTACSGGSPTGHSVTAGRQGCGRAGCPLYFGKEQQWERTSGSKTTSSRKNAAPEPAATRPAGAGLHTVHRADPRTTCLVPQRRRCGGDGAHERGCRGGQGPGQGRDPPQLVRRHALPQCGIQRLAGHGQGGCFGINRCLDPRRALPTTRLATLSMLASHIYTQLAQAAGQPTQGHTRPPHLPAVPPPLPPLLPPERSTVAARPARPPEPQLAAPAAPPAALRCLGAPARAAARGAPLCLLPLRLLRAAAAGPPPPVAATAGRAAS